MRLAVGASAERQQDAQVVVGSQVELGSIGHETPAMSSVDVREDRFLDKLDRQPVLLIQLLELALVLRGTARVTINRGLPTLNEGRPWPRS